MRLWSLHPQYLDRQGLLACWREALLAQKVLRGETSGYRNHPQLARFRASPQPLAAIAVYLNGVAAEAGARGYEFNRDKIGRDQQAAQISVTRGQVLFEWAHLLKKLKRRDPARWAKIQADTFPQVNPLFTLVDGPVESWEKTA